MLSWIKTYYKICPIWIIIAFNLLLVVLMSPIPLIGAVFAFGLVQSATGNMQIIGWLLFASIPIGVFISNLLLYKIVKIFKYDKEEDWKKVIEADEPKYFLIKIAATIMTILIGFAVMFIFDDLWMIFNSWWA